MNLAMAFWNGPNGIKSPSENKRNKKSLVSGTVEGPPMFMKTTAVPFDFGVTDVETRRMKFLSMLSCSMISCLHPILTLD